MKILINNEEVVCSHDFTINLEMLNTPSVILNNVYPKTWENDKDYVSRFYHPDDYSQCVIEDDNSNMLFCGVVKNSGNISLNPRHPHFSTLQILDYKTFLSEGELSAFVIADKTIEEAIQLVIDDIAEYGFELGTINILNPDEIIGAYSTKDKSAYDVFNYIADITQSKWSTRVLGIGRIAIDFYDPSLMPQGTSIQYTKEWFLANLIDDINYQYSAQDYRNKQVMTSKEVFGSIVQNQTIVYDGYTSQLMTELPIGVINSITVNGNEQSFCTNEDKNFGIIANFYYSIGNNFFEKNTDITVGSQITISYIPIVEGRQIVTNSNEISRISNSTGVKGVVSRYENRNDAVTSNELQQIGQSYIKYKGVSEITLTVQTRSNLWNIGERVTFNAPIDELSTEYMVKSKKINYLVNSNMIFYTFELSSSFNSEQAINYFDNQRAKSQGNIKEGNFISRNVDIEDQANIIFYDTSATVINITPNNELQSNLETVLGG